MKPALVMLIMAAMVPPAQAAPAAQIQVRTTVFEAGALPGATQPAKVDCQPGEVAVGGGYALRGPELRVIASYPAGPAWVVEVVNAAKTPAALNLSAVCLSGGQPTTVSSTTGRVTCPSGALVAGGGYQTRGLTAAGSMTNSYPSLNEGWVADGPAVTKVFAVCVRGTETVRTVTATMRALAGSPTCAQEPATSALCFWPRSGSQQLSCASGELLTMGGQRTVSGTIPPYGVTAADTSGPMWTFAMSGSGRDAEPLTVEVSALCLRYATEPPPAPPRRVDLSWPVVGGAVLLLLLLLVAIVATVRHLRRRSPSAAAPQLDIVLTGQRTTLRHDAFREVQ